MGPASGLGDASTLPVAAPDTGSLPLRIESPGDRVIAFGRSLTALPDVDDDGTPDLAVGEPGRQVDDRDRMGQAYMVSGATGEVLHELAAPSRTLPGGWGFGASVAAVGDLDSDDTPDLLFSDGEAVWVVSGGRVQSPATKPEERTTETDDPSVVGRYPVQRDGAWGYVDPTGTMVINPQYEDAELFSGGLARVVLDGEPVFIDSTGTVALRLDLSDAGDFSEGLAPASPSDTELWGYVDTTGTFVIEPQFARAYVFSNGRAAVEKNGAFGYVDTQGEMIIEPQFDGARRFGNGRAPVLTGGFVGGEWGYIDRSGEMVIDPQYEEALPFSENRAPVNVGGGMSDKYGFITPDGEMAIEADYDAALPFSNGLAPVQGGFDEEWGYVDRSGKVIIDFAYEFAAPFHGPLGRVATSVAPMAGIQSGHQGGPLQYKLREPEWVYLNERGEQVWP